MDCRIQRGLQNLTVCGNQNTENIYRDADNGTEEHTADKRLKSLLKLITKNVTQDDSSKHDKQAQNYADNLNRCPDCHRRSRHKVSILITPTR